MRKPGAVLLAAPIALGALVGTLIARSRVLRVGGSPASRPRSPSLITVATPSSGTAVPASTPALVSADLFVPIGTAHDPATPFTVTFDRPMDHHSVAAALRVDPPTPYRLEWDSTNARATLRPPGHWRADTLYQVVVGRGATSVEGGSLAAPLRSVVLTGTGGTASIAATMTTPVARASRHVVPVPPRSRAARGRGPGRAPGRPAARRRPHRGTDGRLVPVRAVRHAGARHDLPAVARGARRRERRPVRHHGPGRGHDG